MDNKEVANIDLSFGPAWARQSAEKWVLNETKTKQNVKSKRERRKWQDKPQNAARFGNRNENNAGVFKSGRKKFKIPEKTSERRLPAVFPAVTISFIPERRGLKPLVKQLSSTRRAYSLFEVAATFLSKPEFYAATIEASGNDGGPVAPLYQCAECKAVFTNKQLAIVHCINRHINLFYDREEKDCESPQGNFSCVARCTLSGELLGPPNYHQFNEKLLELHRTRFVNLSIDQYRKKIVNETDTAFIEQWKKEASHKTVYRTKLLNEPLVFERSSHMEQHFIENYASALIREGHRFIVPATASQDLDDQQIKHLIQETWQKETRFPINMAVAIQKMFRQLGLHTFKTSAKMTFVSAVKPHPIDPAQATKTIRNILEWIRVNSGKTRQGLVASLVPGITPESAGVAEIINSLVWLIDRGHVIEFMNGTLAVPNRASFSNKESKATSSSAGVKTSDNVLRGTHAPAGT